METRSGKTLAVNTYKGGETVPKTGGSTILESKSPQIVQAQPNEKRFSQPLNEKSMSRKPQTEKFQSLPFKKRKVVGDWNASPPKRVSTPAVPLPSDVTGGFVSVAESQSSVPIVRTQSWFDSEVNTETWDASLQPHYNLEFQPSVEPWYSVETTPSTESLSSPPIVEKPTSVSRVDAFQLQTEVTAVSTSTSAAEDVSLDHVENTAPTTKQSHLSEDETRNPLYCAHSDMNTKISPITKNRKLHVDERTSEEAQSDKDSAIGSPVKTTDARTFGKPAVNMHLPRDSGKRKQLTGTKDPPFFPSGRGGGLFNAANGIITRAKAKSSDGSLSILLPQLAVPQSNKPTHKSEAHSTKVKIGLPVKKELLETSSDRQIRHKADSRQLKEHLTPNNTVVEEKVSGTEDISKSKDEEPKDFAVSETGRPSANVLQQDPISESCGWVEDKFGENLLTEGKNFRLKPARPDPDFDPSKHLAMATFQYFFDIGYWNQIAELSNMRQQRRLRDDLFMSEMLIWKQKGKKGPIPQRLRIEDCKRLLKKDNVITGEEVETFIGIILHMSIYKLPSYRMCWTGRSRVNAIARRMSRRKFELIRSHLTFVDGAESDDPKLQKNPIENASPLLRRFQKQCAELPRDSVLIIGEKQITSDDPAQQSAKIFTLSSQSGLVQEFMWNAESPINDTIATVDVMKTLLSNLPAKQFYSLVLPNGFTSVALLKALLSNGFCATGLLDEAQLDKECKKLLNPHAKMLQQRECLHGATLKDGSVYICRFSDHHEKILTVASTHKKANPMVDIKGVRKPQCVVFASQTPPKETHFVIDSMMNLARRERKPARLAMKIIYWVIGTAVTNSWLLECRWKCMISASYIEAGKTPPRFCSNREPLIDYTLRLAEEMMTLRNVPYLKLNVFGPRRVTAPPLPFDLSTVERKERRSGKTAPDHLPTDAVRLDGVGHIGKFNEEIKPEKSNKLPSGKCRKSFRLKQRRCGNPRCPAKNTRTSFKCIKCGVYLCVLRDRNCFLEFHRTRRLSVAKTDDEDERTHQMIARQSVDPKTAEGVIEPIGEKANENVSRRAKWSEAIESSEESEDEETDDDEDI